MRKSGKQRCLLAYISASRLGHQGWETIMHCSYASSKGRQLIVFLSPGVVNKAFGTLNSDCVRFIYLPGCFLVVAQAPAKLKCELKSVLKSVLSRATVDCLRQIRRRFRRGPQSEAGGERPLPSASQAGYRWGNDSLGILFDRLTLKAASLRSVPFCEWGADYHDFRLPCTHFRPLIVQGRFAQHGDTLLRNLGLSPTDWFVCLHARESSSMGDTTAEYRNQEIGNYLLAIEYITSLGGYVIRMGDPSMKPLPSMRNVVDYAHSPYRSSFADLYLSTGARFFIGCTSGLRVLPVFFETPIVNVNIYPLSPLDMSEKSLTIFKHVYSVKEGRNFTLREILEEPTLYFRFHDVEYCDAGLRIVENTPIEILCAVQEMLGFLSKDPEFTTWTPEQNLFQTRIREVLARLRQRGLGDADTRVYPDAICRIGSTYYQENW